MPNDQGAGHIDVFSTDTMTGPENQRMMTTAYMENGGYQDMFGSNTAYNEEPQQDKTWLERNSDWLIPVATALATTGAGIYYNNKQQDKQNNFNAEQAQINRDYQTEMANTAHQREMADLLATGLNPVNTATGGGGANTPAGSAATGVNPAYMDHSSMANTALSLAETMKVLNENKYISPEKKAQIANTIADTTNKSANTEMTHANTNLIKEQAKQIKIDNITRDDLNRMEYVLKSTEAAKNKEEAIQKALQNAYNKATGTTADQDTIERITSIAYAYFVKNPIQGINKAINYAIEKVTNE